MIKKFGSKVFSNKPEDLSNTDTSMDQTQDPILESLQNDIFQIGESLMEISHKVLDEGISEFPIFVASQEIVDIGKPVFDRDTIQLNWFYYASFIEEFTKKELILPDNIAQFQRIYSNPREIACIFVISHEEDARFVFVPYTLKE